MQSQDSKVNSVLWVMVAACAIFMVLWVFGVRASRPEPMAVQLVEALAEDENAEPMPLRSRSAGSFDEVLPQERVVIDDGRDPDAPLL